MVDRFSAEQPGGPTGVRGSGSRLSALSRRTFLATSTAVILTRPVPAMAVTPPRYAAGYSGGYR